MEDSTTHTGEAAKILNSTTHTDRMEQLHSRKRKYEEEGKEFLTSKGISEEELMRRGYTKKVWLHELEPRFSKALCTCDEYTCYQSLSGKEVKRFCFGKCSFEEERMVYMADNLASTFEVPVDRIALKKELSQSGEIKVYVTILSQ